MENKREITKTDHDTLYSIGQTIGTKATKELMWYNKDVQAIASRRIARNMTNPASSLKDIIIRTLLLFRDPNINLAIPAEDELFIREMTNAMKSSLLLGFFANLK